MTFAKEDGSGYAANRRFFDIAGVTVQVESDIPFGETTFEPKFDAFEVDAPGNDTIVVRHHFGCSYRRMYKVQARAYQMPSDGRASER